MEKKLLLSIVALFWFAQYVYVPQQAPYLLHIGTAPSMVGIVIGAYGLTQLLLRLPIGILADRQGNHKKFLLFGVLAAGSASMLRLYSADVYGFLAGNLLSGVASTMWISFMVLYSSYFSARDMGRAMGLINGANNFGVLIGFFACSFFYEDWGMSFLCYLSVAAVIPALFLVFKLNDVPKKLTPLPICELVTVYRDRRLWFFSLLALLQQGILMSTCMSFTGKVITDLGGTSFQVGFSAVTYIVAAVCSAYFAASAKAIRLGMRYWIPRVFLILAFYCLSVPLLPNVKAVFAAQILAGISTGMLFSYSTAEAMKNVPQEKKSTAMGLHQAIYAIGMTFVPVLAGIAVQHISLQSAFYGESVLAFLGACAAFSFYKREKMAEVKQFSC